HIPRVAVKIDHRLGRRLALVLAFGGEEKLAGADRERVALGLALVKVGIEIYQAAIVGVEEEPIGRVDAETELIRAARPRRHAIARFDLKFLAGELRLLG